MYYVYHLIDPRTNEPFYIGKGKDDRCYRHLNETYKNTENKKKFGRICQIRKHGFEPSVKFIHENIIDENEAYDLEYTEIKKYGRQDIEPSGILTNICEDNRPPNVTGYKRSEETKKKISLKNQGEKNGMYGKTYTTEELEKMSIRNSGVNNGFYGKKHTEKTKKLMKEKRALQPPTSGMYGKNHTEHTKQKLREANKKQFEDPWQIEMRHELSRKHNKGRKWYYHPKTLKRKFVKEQPGGYLPGQKPKEVKRG